MTQRSVHLERVVLFLAGRLAGLIARVMLIAALLFANVVVERAVADPSCNKDCGCMVNIGPATRSCTEQSSTCYITDCSEHVPFCGYTDNHNDYCTTQPFYYCYGSC
jgi:hypothetical protein